LFIFFSVSEEGKRGRGEVMGANGKLSATTKPQAKGEKKKKKKERPTIDRTMDTATEGWAKKRQNVLLLGRYQIWTKRRA
jgi:hypothetical protein